MSRHGAKTALIEAARRDVALALLKLQGAMAAGDASSIPAAAQARDLLALLDRIASARRAAAARMASAR